MSQIVEGVEYTTINEMCEAYDCSVSSYYRDIANGKTALEALTRNKLGYKPIDKSRRTDHTGKVFQTRQEMCIFWNLSQSTLDARLDKGASLEEALTGQIFTVWDHTGKGFVMLKDMLAYWNISKDQYYKRKQQGYTLKQILTNDVNHTKASVKDRTDHEGRVFDRVDEMLEYWKVSKGTYQDRKKRGWPMKDRLLGRGHKANAITEDDKTDPFGNTYPSVAEMCRTYKVGLQTYYRRINQGDPEWTKAEALGIVLRLDKGTKEEFMTNDLKVEGFVHTESDEMYFACKFNSGVEEILSKSELVNYALRNIQNGK